MSALVTIEYNIPQKTKKCALFQIPSAILALILVKYNVLLSHVDVSILKRQLYFFFFFWQSA